LKDLVDRLLAGDAIAAARVMSIVENGRPEATEFMHALFPHTGGGYRIGVTGPPGVGKSTLVDKLALKFRSAGSKIGIIGVDPTSPFSGGAILGDRIRMADVATDPDVFIRSMASRGSRGGLATTARQVADVLDAFGKDVIIIETVGVGQVELDIAEVSDTTIVVLVPAFGDAVQAMKAGLMEIGDLFVVNKADHDGADRAVLEIESILQLKAETDWETLVLCTIATEAGGIDELFEAIGRHRVFLETHALLQDRRRRRIESEVRTLVETRLRQELWGPGGYGELSSYVDLVVDGEETPVSAARRILEAKGLVGVFGGNEI